MEQEKFQNTLKLKVDTGKIVVPIEDTDGECLGKMTFIPTDSDILKRYGDVVEFFNSTEFSEGSSEQEIMEYSDHVKEQFDYLFGYKVSEALFQKCGPLTIVSGGEFFFESVLDGISSIIEQITNERIEKRMAKVRKATARYHK